MDASGFDISGLTAVGIVTIAGFYVGRVAKRMRLPSIIGTSVLTTITATSIFFEIIGPILTKIALTKAGEVNAAVPGK